MPFVMATGIGLSVRNAQGVIEAILGKKSEFARTPKFKIEGKSGTFAAKKYKNKSGWMPYFEIGLGLYFALAILYAITNENYAHRPVPVSFCLGLPLHRLHVAQPVLVRASPLRRERSGNAPGLQRCPRFLRSSCRRTALGSTALGQNGRCSKARRTESRILRRPGLQPRRTACASSGL